MQPPVFLCLNAPRLKNMEQFKIRTAGFKKNHTY